MNNTAFPPPKITSVFSAHFITLWACTGVFGNNHDESRDHWVFLHFQCHIISPRRHSWSWSVVCVPASINCKQQMIFFFLNYPSLLNKTQFLCVMSAPSTKRDRALISIHVPVICLYPSMQYFMSSWNFVLWWFGPRGQWHLVTSMLYDPAESSLPSVLASVSAAEKPPSIPFSMALHLHNHKILIQAYAKLFLSPH